MKSLYKCAECLKYFENDKIKELHESGSLSTPTKLVCNDCLKAINKAREADQNARD